MAIRIPATAAPESRGNRVNRRGAAAREIESVILILEGRRAKARALVGTGSLTLNRFISVPLPYLLVRAPYDSSLPRSCPNFVRSRLGALPPLFRALRAKW